MFDLFFVTSFPKTPFVEIPKFDKICVVCIAIIVPDIKRFSAKIKRSGDCNLLAVSD